MFSNSVKQTIDIIKSQIPFEFLDGKYHYLLPEEYRRVLVP
jgi:hypothetical protein